MLSRPRSEGRKLSSIKTIPPDEVNYQHDRPHSAKQIGERRVKNTPRKRVSRTLVPTGRNHSSKNVFKNPDQDDSCFMTFLPDSPPKGSTYLADNQENRNNSINVVRPNIPPDSPKRNNVILNIKSVKERSEKKVKKENRSEEDNTSSRSHLRRIVKKETPENDENSRTPFPSVSKKKQKKVNYLKADIGHSVKKCSSSIFKFETKIDKANNNIIANIANNPEDYVGGSSIPSKDIVVDQQNSCRKNHVEEIDQNTLIQGIENTSSDQKYNQFRFEGKKKNYANTITKPGRKDIPNIQNDQNSIIVDETDRKKDSFIADSIETSNILRRELEMYLADIKTKTDDSGMLLIEFPDDTCESNEDNVKIQLQENTDKKKSDIDPELQAKIEKGKEKIIKLDQILDNVTKKLGETVRVPKTFVTQPKTPIKSKHKTITLLGGSDSQANDSNKAMKSGSLDFIRRNREVVNNLCSQHQMTEDEILRVNNIMSEDSDEDGSKLVGVADYGFKVVHEESARIDAIDIALESMLKSRKQDCEHLLKDEIVDSVSCNLIDQQRNERLLKEKLSSIDEQLEMLQQLPSFTHDDTSLNSFMSNRSVSALSNVSKVSSISSIASTEEIQRLTKAGEEEITENGKASEKDIKKLLQSLSEPMKALVLLKERESLQSTVADEFSQCGSDLMPEDSKSTTESSHDRKMTTKRSSFIKPKVENPSHSSPSHLFSDPFEHIGPLKKSTKRKKR